MRRVALLLVAAGAVALASPSLAAATTRFAAPGGTAPDTICTTRDMPCSIGAAAGGPDVTRNDEAIILPGNYTQSDLNGDTDQPNDHVVHPTAGVVRGEDPTERPVITLGTETSVGAFVIGAGTVLSDIEIDTDADTRDITILGGTVNGLIARSSRNFATVCATPVTTSALIRNTACLSSGEGANALGVNTSVPAGKHTITLRNVTAVATGVSSFGMTILAFGPPSSVDLTADGDAVIARGDEADIRAGGLSLTPTVPNSGAKATVSLGHSNFATTMPLTDAGGGTTTISAPGSATNQTDPPRLAPDGYHELAGSPTLEGGAVDAASGVKDIDGQNRTIGQLPDIGADEIGFPTSTAIRCTPNPTQFGSGPVLCAVTVTDTSSPQPVSFHSGIRLHSERIGAFGGNCEVLGMSAPTQGSCTQPFSPGGPGVDRITATFPGDAIHDSSSGSDLLNVMALPSGQSGPGPQAPPRRAKCKKKKHHRAGAAKKRKCKKKKRR
ncbi:MAG TPA: hypothetical protein VGE91_05675 [Solirubrobacterales bacterium]|jgi:hypothetical protein